VLDSSYCSHGRLGSRAALWSSLTAAQQMEECPSSSCVWLASCHLEWLLQHSDQLRDEASLHQQRPLSRAASGYPADLLCCSFVSHAVTCWSVQSVMLLAHGVGGQCCLVSAVWGRGGVAVSARGARLEGVPMG
jgi:hypothetical protein